MKGHRDHQGNLLDGVSEKPVGRAPTITKGPQAHPTNAPEETQTPPAYADRMGKSCDHYIALKMHPGLVRFMGTNGTRCITCLGYRPAQGCRDYHTTPKSSRGPGPQQ